MADAKFKLRRDNQEAWALVNPVLQAGEPGLETNTGRYKIGNGTHRWSDLPYFIDEPGVVSLIETYLSGGSTGPLEQHVSSATPHPEYDDLPSLSLLFENGLL